MRKLRIFKEVADSGSVSLAAKRLHMAQPAVSLAIKELEEEYGCALFERLARRFYITQSGRVLLGHVNELVREYNAMEQAMKQPVRDQEMRVGVGVASSHGRFIDAMKWIQKNHPQWHIRVDVHISPVIQKMVLENEADVGIIEGQSTYPQLLTRTLFTEDVVLLGSMASTVESIHVKGLAELPMILREAESSNRAYIDEMMAQKGIHLNVVWSSSSIEIIKRAVSEGLGYTLLPRGVALENIQSGQLKLIRLDGIELKRTVSWVMHRDKAMTLPIETLLKRIEENEDESK